MSVEAGAQFGVYKIVGPLGAGGMGEVYRAADTKLDRQVAIKVLPEAMGRDPERVARFEREAKVLASLNHLHIAAIYGFEEAAGKRFLILELVEGPTLEDRLEAGPLMVEESLDIARQIAEALEAAHEKNVIHRDLKPSNVKITPNGTVKVLDFGLAKALAEESTEEDRGTSPTITRDFTQPGVILGTAAYMSPEQARGRAVDKRTDIWSFGCVLYECLTAGSIFQGETVSDSLAAILHNEPDWERLPADMPPTVQLLLRRCLAKDHRRRLRDIGDARLELEAAIADPSSSVLGLASEALAATTTRPTKLRAAVAAVLVFVLGGLLSAAALWSFRPADKASDWQDLPLRKFEVVIGDNKVDGNEQTSISHAWPEVSPDGKKIVYQWQDALWIREMDKTEPRQLFAREGVSHPFWSPGSDRVAFFYEEKLWTISYLGGPQVQVSPIPKMPHPRVGGGAWSEKHEIFFALGGTVFRVAAGGGDPEVLAEPEKQDNELSLLNPSVLPEDRGVVFGVMRIIDEDIEADTISVHSPVGRTVIHQQLNEQFSYPVYSPTGHIVYLKTSTNPGIWAFPFSLDKLRKTGEPFLIAKGGKPSVAEDGTLVYDTHLLADTPGQAVWVDREGVVVESVGIPLKDMIHPSISPDGKLLAVSAQVGEEGRRIWIQDLAGGPPAMLEKGVYAYAWLPIQRGDEQAPAEIVATDELKKTWRMVVNGTGKPQQVSETNWIDTVSDDGRFLFFSVRGDNGLGPLDVTFLSLAGKAEQTPLLATDAPEGQVSLSPDGRYLAYRSDNDIYVSEIAIDGTELTLGARKKISSGGRWPQWSPKGKELFYLEADQLMSVPIEGDKTPSGKAAPLFRLSESVLLGEFYPYDVDSDGKRFLFVQHRPDQPAVQKITVVQNWFSEKASK